MQRTLQKKTEEPKQDLKYSDNVQTRIGELTRNWRESQRREKAAMQYAKGLQKKWKILKKDFQN